MSQSLADPAEIPVTGFCYTKTSAGQLSISRTGPELRVCWQTGTTCGQSLKTKDKRYESAQQRLQNGPPWKLRLGIRPDLVYVSMMPCLALAQETYSEDLKIDVITKVTLGEHGQRIGSETTTPMTAAKMRDTKALLQFSKKQFNSAVQVADPNEELFVVCKLVPHQPEVVVEFDRSPYRSLAMVFDNSSVADVVFEFPSANGQKTKTICAVKAILGLHSTYYKTMFESDFAESKPGATNSSSENKRALMEDDSDNENEEDGHSHASDVMSIREERDTLLASKTKIPILDFTHTTYYAVLRYIYLGSISFAPLRSTYRRYCKEVMDSGKAKPDLEAWNLANATHVNPLGDELYVASPKSVYRLAQKLDIKPLEELAKKQIVASTNNDTALDEAMSTFASLYPDMRTELIAYVKKNWGVIGKSSATEALWERTKDDRIWFEVMRGFA